MWAANKFTDTKGNYFSVTYNQDIATGAYQPVRIAYTGNVNANSAPFATVEFQYARRPDVESVYDVGSVTRATLRLTNIQTFVAARLVRDHRLDYEQSLATLRSRLSSVTLCDSGINVGPLAAWNGGKATTLECLGIRY
jgi:hypothetical protein